MMMTLYAWDVAAWRRKNNSFSKTESVLCRNAGTSACQLQEGILKNDDKM